MKAFVITIMDMPASRASAQRCIESVKDFPVEMWEATTPKDDPHGMLKQRDIDTRFFDEQGNSFKDNCMSAFTSHLRIWEWCAIHEEEVIIFEHDAVAVAPIPKFMNYQGCVTLGQPSYGKFQTPMTLGVGPLMHKPYFGGAHAYRLKPDAAKVLLEVAKHTAQPTDVFLSLDKFPWLQEYYPWPVVAQDEFTTIQRKGGCLAKHNWNEAKYGIYKVR